MSGTKIRKFPSCEGCEFLEYVQKCNIAVLNGRCLKDKWCVEAKGHLEELLEKNKICNDCPVSDFCVYEDCPAFDKLKEIYVSLGGDEKHE